MQIGEQINTWHNHMPPHKTCLMAWERVINGKTFRFSVVSKPEGKSVLVMLDTTVVHHFSTLEG